MLNDDQRMSAMFTGVANCFNVERTLGWSRSQLLAVLNVSALPLFATTTSIGLRYVIALVGVMLNLVWYYGVNRRSRKRVKYWQNCLAQMEPTETYLLVFRVFSGSGSKMIIKPPLFYAVNLLPWTFLAVWVTAIVNTRFPGEIELFFDLLRERGVL
jgi:hypothetical protein